MLFDHAKVALGDKFDKPGSRMVADGSKGFQKAFSECFENKTSSYCSNHFGESITRCGKGAKGLFLKAVAAGTLAELAEAKNNFSVNPKLVEKLKDIPDHQLYPVAFNDSTHITTNNHAESANKQHLRGRKLNVVIALRDIMEMQQEAHTAALVEMNHENSPVPYNLRELDGYKNAEENARFLVSRVTWLDGEAQLKGKVLGATGTTHNFDLEKFDCDCHEWPHCAHLSAGSKAKGSCIVAFYKAPHTVAYWKDQMDAVGDFPPVPSRAAVDARRDLWDDSLRLPTAMKKKSGAPKKNARRLGALEQAAKRAKSVTALMA